MNQTSSTCPADLQVHHNFRWVLYANHIEPVRSFLGRYFRRQLANTTACCPVDVPGTGSTLMVVERVLEWLPKVWQRVNRFLESHTSFDITIGMNRPTLSVDDDDDESKSYVRPLLQLETVTSVLVIHALINSSVFRSWRNDGVWWQLRSFLTDRRNGCFFSFFRWCCCLEKATIILILTMPL